MSEASYRRDGRSFSDSCRFADKVGQWIYDRWGPCIATVLPRFPDLRSNLSDFCCLRFQFTLGLDCVSMGFLSCFGAA